MITSKGLVPLALGSVKLVPMILQIALLAPVYGFSHLLAHALQIPSKIIILLMIARAVILLV